MQPRITSRNTKAEILAAYNAAQSSLAAGPSWDQVWDKACQTIRQVSRETLLLVKDCYNAGAATRLMYSQVVAELRRPLLKP